MHVIFCCVIVCLQSHYSINLSYLLNVVCLQQVKKVKTFGKMAEDMKCLSKEKKTTDKN